MARKKAKDFFKGYRRLDLRETLEGLAVRKGNGVVFTLCAFQPAKNPELSILLKFPHSQVRTMLEEPKCEIFEAEEENKSLGFGAFVLFESNDHGNGKLYIQFKDAPDTRTSGD